MNNKVENLNSSKNAWTDAQRLAVRLHDVNCRATEHNYVDCSFYYMDLDGSFDWGISSRMFYLDKANKILSRVNYDAADFMLDTMVNG